MSLQQFKLFCSYKKHKNPGILLKMSVTGADTVQKGLILGVQFTLKIVSGNNQNAEFAVLTP